MAKRTMDMTTGSPVKHLVSFSLPLILTNMGRQLYTVADGAIVGRGVGVKAFAAIGATDWCPVAGHYSRCPAGRWQVLRIFLDVQEAGGFEALQIAVRYLSIMSVFFVVVHILHVFRNVLQAMGIAVWSLLFLAEPAAWLGAMLCVTMPYFYYRKKLLMEKTG